MLKVRAEKKKKAYSFAIHTLGCKVNTYESDAMSEALKRAGFTERAFSEPADVYIVNTCTVTNVADKKSRQMLHRAKKLNPEALVVAAGCYVDAAMQNEAMQAVLKDAAIDVWVTNQEKGQLLQILSERLMQSAAAECGAEKSAEAAGARAVCERPETASENGTGGCGEAASAAVSEKPDGLFITELDGHTRAFVKVQDGCNQFCAYCIIPYVRGRIKSRPIEDCVSEIRRLSENGVREVVLTGIHLSSYGKDFRRAEDKAAASENGSGAEQPAAAARAGKETDTSAQGSGNAAEGTFGQGNAGKTAGRKTPEACVCESDDIVNTADAPLLTLIRAVHALSGIARIRLGSLEPRLMTEAFVSELAKLPKVCPHFHLSLQSGCAETLRRMNRHYTPDEFEQSCKILRRHYPHPAITTDVIVGFPQETEAEFEACRAFIEKIGFYELHVFKYSRRAGTRADRMDGQIDEGTKERRSRVLLSLAEKMSHEFRTFYLGRETEFLCEETVSLSGKTYAVGFNREYVKCLKETASFSQNELLSGKASEICKEKAVYESLVLR